MVGQNSNLINNQPLALMTTDMDLNYFCIKAFKSLLLKIDDIQAFLLF